MLKTPPLQTATATIDTLSGRLASATLLEDRRAAILGLRSFAKQYPASVASGSLRELITTLRRDGLGQESTSTNGSARSSKDGGRSGGEEAGDVDTIRLVLETLLMLFNPDDNSPEASEQIVMFLADEFSMRQDNVALTLALLVYPADSAPDYYSRLYALQLLTAVAGARPERIQEAILGSPFGISRLVSCLDDPRDAVRNAALLVLVDLTTGAGDDFRKIVMFEDTCPHVFNLIQAEGGLAEGGITTQDSLSLIANLVRANNSNQASFRESGCVGSLVSLLRDAFPPSEQEAGYTASNRAKNAWGLLQLLLLFLTPGEASTPANQAAFYRSGIAQLLLDLAFTDPLNVRVRASALQCAAAVISGNQPLQENFASLTVVLPSAQPEPKQPPKLQRQVNGTTSTEVPRTHVIEALLELALSSYSASRELRSGASALVQAYFTGHERVKHHFLFHAIELHRSNPELPGNAVTTLLAGPGGDSDAAALRYASHLMQNLLVGDDETKKVLASVTAEEAASEDEEPVTFIQALGSHLQSGLVGDDGKDVADYASLLAVFLWDYAAGVNDLLSEGSALLQALVDAAKQSTADPVTAGLAAALLGTIYEFSTKDSPIPRRTLAPLLTAKLGRQKYLDALLALRRHPAVRDHGLESEDFSPRALPPTLSNTLVDVFQEEYTRLRKSVDREPGLEVLPRRGSIAGVDRDVLDDLRGQLQSTRDALSAAQQEALGAQQGVEQAKMESNKALHASQAEVDRLRKINEAVQRGHEEELQKLEQVHSTEKKELEERHVQALAQRDSHVQQTATEHERRLEETRAIHQRQMDGAQQARQESLVQLSKQVQNIATLTEKLEAVRSAQGALSSDHQALQLSHEQLGQQHTLLQVARDDLRGELSASGTTEEELSASVARLETRVRELHDELKAREAELKIERDGFAQLETELETAKASASTNTASTSAAHNEKLQLSLKEHEAAEADKDTMAKELESTRRASDKAKDAEKTAKEELESMLLVMGDIEAKRDLYKARLKAKGGEVTESEDEDEDGEDEGEQDVD